MESSMIISLWLVQLLHINDRVLKRVLQMFVNSRLPVSAYICKCLFLFQFTIEKICSIKYKCHREKNMKMLLLQGRYLWIFQMEAWKIASCHLLFLPFTHPSCILLSISILPIICPSNSLPLNWLSVEQPSIHLIFCQIVF